MPIIKVRGHQRRGVGGGGGGNAEADAAARAAAGNHIGPNMVTRDKERLQEL